MNDKVHEGLIEENLDYMLGMYDLYQNDDEIINILKAKGLSNEIISEILNRIKIPSYQKRIKQAKRNLYIGALLVLLFVVMPYSVIKLNDSDLNEFQARMGSGHSSVNHMVNLYFEAYYAIALGLISYLIISIMKLIKYRKLFNEVPSKQRL